MLHRLRSVLVRPGRDRLTGTVEVDETFIGGQEPGLRGGRARGKKVLTGIAVEAGTPNGIGRCRMAVLEDASAESLNPFVTGAVEPGSIVITGGWQGYSGLEAQAEWLASAGYLALSVDLGFWRRPSACLLRIFRDLRAGRGQTFDEVNAARAWLAGQPGCDGWLGVIRFCTTGGFALHGFSV
jgi:hypothetical protein